jgi:hypothetical protein
MVTCGMMYIPKLINFHPAILYLRNAHIRKSFVKTLGCVGLGWVGLGYVRLGEVSGEQRVMGSGVIIIPPHKFKQLSCWYYRVRILPNYEFAIITYGITSMPNFIKTLTHVWLLMRTDGYHK